MNRPEDTCMADYKYVLPESRIAKYPLANRAGSKLLIYQKEEITQDLFSSLPKLLPRLSTLVFNNTRVIHARLQFRKTTGASIEIFCLEPFEPPDYERAMQAGSGALWKCLIGNKRKWKGGILQDEFGHENDRFQLRAEWVKTELNTDIIRFSWEQKKMTFADILEQAGTIPIPPYLKRPAEAPDNKWYQTVYAQQNGSVAAPTAGLHFTPELIRKLSQNGFSTIELTLHVGAGTFKPVLTPNLRDHAMHTEHFFIEKSQLVALLEMKGPLISVGTTSVRTLESLYWLGVKINKGLLNHGKGFYINQWEPYSLPTNFSRNHSLEILLKFMDEKNLNRLEGTTRIIIVPGYKYKMINGLITNYHQPHSTLLLLVAAFIGENWKKVYKYAMDHNFRFLSYGDSSLLLP